jgi:hypothetical protein
MGFIFSHKDLKTDMLSCKALALLSEFALIWYVISGELINLDSEDVVISIFQKAKQSNNRRLLIIYLHLRAEFSNELTHLLPDCDAMLVEQALLNIEGASVSTEVQRRC